MFDGTDIKIKPSTCMLSDYDTSLEDIWERIFLVAYEKRGISWLASVEIFCKKLEKNENIGMPRIFSSLLLQQEQKIDSLSEASLNLLENKESSALEIIEAETQTDLLAEASLRMLERKEIADESLKQVEEQLTRDPLTELHNESFFKQFLLNAIKESREQSQSWSLCLISLDNHEKIQSQFGETVGQENLVAATYLLSSTTKDSYNLFKLDGFVFALFMPSSGVDEAIQISESIRVAFENSESFIVPMTVSIGGISDRDFHGSISEDKQLNEKVIGGARLRMNAAKQAGMNNVVFDSALDATSVKAGVALVIDSDPYSVDLVTSHLKNIGIEVIALNDGMEALELIQSSDIDIVISEVVNPKLDVFGIRQKLLESSDHKDIPFIVLSHQKNEEDIRRAYGLGIWHYLKKPYHVAEIIGIVKAIMKT